METTTVRKALAIAGFGTLAMGAAALGARSAYVRARRELRAPWVEPLAWTFASAWVGLHALVAASGYRVWRSPPSPERTTALTLWGAQLGLDAASSCLFFGRHDRRAALASVGLLRISLDAYAVEAEKVDPAGRWMMAPYRRWVGLATMLSAVRIS